MKREHQPAEAVSDTVPVTFSKTELWLLQKVLRHEIQGAETWKYPPCSPALNDDIAAAILLCEEQQQNEAALCLSKGDLYALDYCVPADAKDVNGRPLGTAILLKSYVARRALSAPILLPDAPSPTKEPSRAEVVAALAAKEVRNGTDDHDPGDDADDHPGG